MNKEKLIQSLKKTGWKKIKQNDNQKKVYAYQVVYTY